MQHKHLKWPITTIHLVYNSLAIQNFQNLTLLCKKKKNELVEETAAGILAKLMLSTIFNMNCKKKEFLTSYCILSLNAI